MSGPSREFMKKMEAEFEKLSEDQIATLNRVVEHHKEQDEDIFGEEGCLPSPQWPLKFEKLSGTENSDSTLDYLDQLQKMSKFATDISSEAKILQDEGESVFSGLKKSEIYKATLLALQAHSITNDDQAAAHARKALAVCDICPEAYIVLALREANTYEEALVLFKTAMELGIKVITPDDLQAMLINERKNMWERIEMRSYLRGIFGVGNTLRKMGNCKEALPYYEHLSKLIIGYDPTWSTFFDFNAHFPQLWFEVYGPKECLKRMKNHSPKETMHHPACGVPWFATMALALFATGKYSEYYGQFNKKRDGKSISFDEKMKNYRKGDCWPSLLEWVCPQAVELLLEKKPMPKADKMPRLLPKPDSITQAATYSQECRHLWKETPGALEFLLKMRNTHTLFKLFHGPYLLNQRIAPEPGKIDLDRVKNLMDEGFFVNANTNMYGFSTLLELVYDHQEIALELINRGANPSLCGLGRIPTALQLACYYADAGRPVVRAMLQSGMCDPYVELKGKIAPIFMAVEQGNWQELDEILNFFPYDGKKTFKDIDLNDPLQRAKDVPGDFYFFSTIFHSSCRECVAGGDTCGRCSNGIGVQHSVHCDYRKVIDVLFKHGIVPALQFLEQMEGLINMPGPSGGLVDADTPLAKYLIWKMKRNGCTCGRNHAAMSSCSPEDGSDELVAWCSYPLCCNTNETMKLKMCGACMHVRYCSDRCQKKHWKVWHRRGCKEFQKQQKEEAAAGGA